MYDQNNPEFIVYQTLRMLPETYVVLYWRRPNSRVTGRHFKYPAHYQSKVDTHAHEPQMLTPNKISLFPPGYSFLAVGRFLFDK